MRLRILKKLNENVKLVRKALLYTYTDILVLKKEINREEQMKILSGEVTSFDQLIEKPKNSIIMINDETNNKVKKLSL